MGKEIVLSTRQKLLYDYLAKQTVFKNLKDIAQESGLYGEIPSVDVNNCVWIRLLKKDIQVLRKSYKVETDIISNTRNGVKIATKEEYKIYSKNRWDALDRARNLLKLQDKKAGLDGQYKHEEDGSIRVVKSYIS